MTLPSPVRSFLLGVVTGSRSQLGLAALAWTPADPADPRPARLLRAPAGRVVTTLAAGGELVGDKLPNAPSRLARGPLTARIVQGGVTAALAAARGGRSAAVTAAALGAAGAYAGSVAGARFRSALPARTGTPDLPWAVAEDAAAVSLAALATRPVRCR